MAKPNVINKDDLLEAAKQCLVEEGLQGFTLRAVAKTAGVTQGTVYYHFRTKEQLLIDMARDVCEKEIVDIKNTEKSDNVLSDLMEQTKEQYAKELFDFKLSFMLLVIGFDYPEIETKLREVVARKRKIILDNITHAWSKQPVEGVSNETWAIIMQSFFDGLTLQMMQEKDIDINQTFNEISLVIEKITELTKEARKRAPRRRFSMLKEDNLFY